MRSGAFLFFIVFRLDWYSMFALYTAETSADDFTACGNDDK